MLLVITTVVPLVLYWIAYKKGKFVAQVIIGLVSLVIPDACPLIDEITMNFVSLIGFFNRNLLPKLMKVFAWVSGIAIIIAIILCACLMAD